GLRERRTAAPRGAGGGPARHRPGGVSPAGRGGVPRRTHLAVERRRRAVLPRERQRPDRRRGAALRRVHPPPTPPPRPPPARTLGAHHPAVRALPRGMLVRERVQRAGALALPASRVRRARRLALGVLRRHALGGRVATSRLPPPPRFGTVPPSLPDGHPR